MVPSRYIESVKFPDGHVLQSNCKCARPSRCIYRDHFARCPDLLTCPDLAFGRLKPLAARVWLLNAKSLTHVGVSKSPGIDDLPCEVYLRLPRMFVPILTDMFNHWFAQEVISGSVTKGVITLLKKVAGMFWGT